MVPSFPWALLRKPFATSRVLPLAFGLALLTSHGAAAPMSGASAADRALAEYFRFETKRLTDQCLAEVQTAEDWERLRGTCREQLREMLGLAPLPERGDLKAVVTGTVEAETFIVEKLHFQSLPGLYVTANLYIPRNLQKPAPTILYLSGHGPVISNGISYGNKVAYQHHGAWFARNGYVCLILDTLQLGEIQGLHHGTHREKMWWWNSRGYTPAGVEAWNSIRALDYLETRREVDATRFGATGRSGGGAYSWWIAALDDRIKAAAPVAGITDLQNHVVDGTVEGHCDCMFTVNTYRWDYPQVAALVAPRALLIVNSDADSIFPLDGVQRTHAAVRRIYALHKAQDKLGLVIGPGPHKDTQDLQVPVFRWFNKHLKGEDPLIEMAATKFFTPEQLRVFARLPSDAINTNVHDTFVPSAKTPVVPKSKSDWQQQRDAWMAGLKEKVFRGWPETEAPLRLERTSSASRDGLRLEAFDFDSQPGVRLRLYCVSPAEQPKAGGAVLRVVDENGWRNLIANLRRPFAGELTEELRELEQPSSTPGGTDAGNTATDLRVLKEQRGITAFLAPRGIGLTGWNPDARKQTQIRRRFMLLGQTLDGMRVWDIRRACRALRETAAARQSGMTLEAEGSIAVDALYAALFEAGIEKLALDALPASHRVGPDYLNVLRVLDVPHAVALAAERTRVVLDHSDASAWSFPVSVAQKLELDSKRFGIEFLSSAASQ